MTPCFPVPDCPRCHLSPSFQLKRCVCFSVVSCRVFRKRRILSHFVYIRKKWKLVIVMNMCKSYTFLIFSVNITFFLLYIELGKVVVDPYSIKKCSFLHYWKFLINVNTSLRYRFCSVVRWMASRWQYLTTLHQDPAGFEQSRQFKSSRDFI